MEGAEDVRFGGEEGDSGAVSAEGVGRGWLGGGEIGGVGWLEVGRGTVGSLHVVRGHFKLQNCASKIFAFRDTL